MTGVAPRDPNTPAAPEVLAALFAAATAPCDRALLALVADAGLRPWEACALAVSDVAAGGSSVRPGRGPLRRVVLTGDHAAALVAAVGGRADGPLLVTARGRPVGPSVAARRLAALAKRAGVCPAPTLPQLRAAARGGTSPQPSGASAAGHRPAAP